VNAQGRWVYHQYMSWIDERIEQRAEIERRDRLIDDHATKIYMAVWSEIMEVVQEGSSKGFPLTAGGSLHERMIMLRVSSGNERTVHFTMKDKRKIHASGDGVELWLELDVCDGGIVCLKNSGEQITVQEAARCILDPFLFPEFGPGRKPASTSGFQSAPRLV
jgi:hypothetical protein